MAYTAPAPEFFLCEGSSPNSYGWKFEIQNTTVSECFGMFWVFCYYQPSILEFPQRIKSSRIKSPKIWGTDEFEAKVCELFGASQRGGGAMGWSYRHRGSDSDCSNVDHYVFVPIVVKKSPFQSQSLVQSPWATCIPTYHWSPFHKKSTSTWLRGLI